MLDMSVRARIEGAVAAARPKGWGCSVRVVDRELLVMTVQRAPHDPLAFLVHAAAAAGRSPALVADLRVAHARRHCRPVWVPSDQDIDEIAAHMPEHLLAAGRVLARLHGALLRPVADARGLRAQAGATFPATFQIGSEGKPFLLTAARPATDVIALHEWVNHCLPPDDDDEARDVQLAPRS